VQRKGSEQSGVSSWGCGARGVQLVPGAIALPDSRQGRMEEAAGTKEPYSGAGSC